MPELLIDQREGNEVFQAFDEQKISYKKEQLELGDIIFENICIEHKQLPDLLYSLYKGHLQKQLLDMQARYERSYLVITGNLPEFLMSPQCPSTFTPKNCAGIFASLAVRYPKISMIQIPSISLLPLLVQSLIEKTLDGKQPTVFQTELMKQKLTTYDYRVKILTCFPNIGFVRAKKLIEEDSELASKLDELINRFVS